MSHDAYTTLRLKHLEPNRRALSLIVVNLDSKVLWQCS